MPTQAYAKCSTGSISSFPLTLGITATDQLYGSVDEPVTMDIQWGSRATAPVLSATGTTDEVGAGNTNLTTIRFLNNTYTISAVQLIKASHGAWILPTASQSLNTEDIVMTFSTSSTTTQYNYLTIVIPILRSGSATPTYLNGLAGTATQGPYNLKDCFPASPTARFAYYATCLNGYSGSAATQNVYVFVSTDGISVSPTLMTTIEAKIGPTYSPPFLSRLSTKGITIRSAGDFTKLILTTTQLNSMNKKLANVNSNQRTDDTDAYKCMPLDPDASISSGQLTVDISTGKTLTTVLDERDALRAAHMNSNSPSAKNDPNRFTKYFGSAIGIFLVIILFLCLVFLAVPALIKAVSKSPTPAAGVAAAAAVTTPAWMTSFASYTFAAAIAGISGLCIGLSLS